MAVAAAESRGIFPMRLPRVRFTIFDTMALIAATAVGLASARGIDPGGFWPRPGFLLRWLFFGPSTCLAAAWAAGLLLLTAVRPRRLRKRLLKQPGLTAGVAALVSMAVGFLGFVGYLSVHTEPPNALSIQPAGAYWFAAYQRTSEFVIGAWVGLWITGRWSAGRNWVDRAGRAVGLFWIVQFAYAGVGVALNYVLRSF